MFCVLFWFVLFWMCFIVIFWGFILFFGLLYGKKLKEVFMCMVVFDLDGMLVDISGDLINVVNVCFWNFGLGDLL